MEENNDGNDTNVGSMENSIEEDIIKIEGLKYLTLQATIKGKFICAKVPEDYIQAIEHILSDYKRVLKENEINEVQEQQLKYYIEELKKYDIRNFKLDDNEQIKSISFTKEQLKFMNLGIALYKNIDKILNDESEEDSDI